mgnify:CR=1 FL=1
MKHGLTIGQLAARTGTNPKTIRYYEAVGLLPPPRRTPAGYRLYGPEDVARLGFIRKARAVGLSLAEIREVLRLRDGGQAPCDHVLAVLNARIAAIDRQVRELRELRRQLRTLRRRGRRTARKGCICGIIESAPSAGENNDFQGVGAPAD